MANVELVIKIPKDIIESAKSSPNYYPIYHFEKIWEAIKDGTPLPKGHGDLKDVNEIKKNQFTLGTSNYCEYKVVKIEDIDKADTIIEADTESEDE